MTKKPSTPSIGELIDLGRKYEQERLEYQRETEEKLKTLKAREDEIEKQILDYCEEHKVEKISGSEATATFHKTPIPTDIDWPKLWAHIKKTGEFDLLEKRVGKTAYRERLDAGKKVPGVSTFWKKSISFSKFGGSK